MGLWSIITGAGKVSDVIDTGLELAKKGASGVDMMFHTEEEKAIKTTQNITVNMAHVIEMAKLAQSESGASAVTRRIFGLIILLNFTVFAMTGLIAVCLGDTTLAENIVKFASSIELGYLAITVSVATFGYYTVTKSKAVRKP